MDPAPGSPSRPGFMEEYGSCEDNMRPLGGQFFLFLNHLPAEVRLKFACFNSNHPAPR